MARTIALGLLLLVGAACADDSPAAEPSRSTSTHVAGSRSPTPTPPTPTPTPASTPASTERPSVSESTDPRWQFFTSDRRRHSSPWFAGERRIMIGYGCNPAPWYSPDPRCPGDQGFHHGIDVAIPCGTRLYSGIDGVVLDPAASGSPGSAYGEHAFRIRSGEVDILIGHTPPPRVRPGDRVRVGEPIARVGDSAAPDGCHLHFEVRRAGGGVSAAVDPAQWLALS
jgi:murein DD-endopeptidase MepM/ murein hydrolase activator NlpD